MIIAIAFSVVTISVYTAVVLLVGFVAAAFVFKKNPKVEADVVTDATKVASTASTEAKKL